MPTKPEALIIVQTRSQKGVGDEYLVALRPDDFNPKALKGHRTDHVVVLLDAVQRHSIGKFVSNDEVMRFIRTARKDRGIERRTKRFRLPFPLPNETDVKRAKMACRVRNLEQRLESNRAYTANTILTIEQYTHKMIEPGIMPGIRTHFEHVLIPDKKTDLRHARKEHRSLEKKLTRAKIALAKLEQQATP